MCCIRGVAVVQYNFEWDPVKATSNLKKHKVSFQEAAEIFLDPLQITIPDEAHPSEEERWITLGCTNSRMLRLVVHTIVAYHKDQITIRIISARKATSHEKKHYEEAPL